MPDVSARYSYVDGESSGSKQSLDEELGISFVVTPGARRAKNSFKTPSNDLGVCRQTRVKYLVDRLTYDGLAAHHYAYMVNVIQEVEPSSLEEALANQKW